MKSLIDSNAHTRKAVGKDGYSNNPIINYQLQMNEIIPLIATTYVYNILLNYIQDRYENQSENDTKEVVRLCCIIKPLITWHSENTASKCRERCGGQGFLAANRFGEAINGSHAGITAEGDNRVILQKVSKELLEEVSKTVLIKEKMLKVLKPNIFAKKVITNKDILKLFEIKEKYLKYDLAYKIGVTKDIYSKWMYEESDDIQSLATSYGERLAVQTMINKINEIDDNNLKKILNDLLKIYSYTKIKEDIGFYFENNLINKKKYKFIKNDLNKLNKKISKKSLDLVDNFNIPIWMRHSPISNNWKTYNEYENNGELDNQQYRNN